MPWARTEEASAIGAKIVALTVFNPHDADRMNNGACVAVLVLLAACGIE